MADARRMSNDDVRTLSRLAQLHLPDERISQLATTFSTYLNHLDRLRQIEVGDSEPPTITYESEARR